MAIINRMKLQKPTPMPKASVPERVSANLRKWMENTLSLNTQAKLGAATGVGQTSVGRLINGIGSPTIDTLAKVAEAFGRDISDLLSTPSADIIDYDKAKYAQLDDHEKRYVETVITNIIEAHDKNEIEKRKLLKSK